MIIEDIKKKVGKEIRTFRKLRDKSLYHFTKWGDDELTFFTYQFTSSTTGQEIYKRVFIKEIEKLLTTLKNRGKISRGDFYAQCKKTNNSGPCGYAVIISILVDLKVVKFVGNGKAIKY